LLIKISNGQDEISQFSNDSTVATISFAKAAEFSGIAREYGDSE
jgi:hypothetical protein